MRQAAGQVALLPVLVTWPSLTLNMARVVTARKHQLQDCHDSAMSRRRQAKEVLGLPTLSRHPMRAAGVFPWDSRPAMARLRRALRISSA
jgi:hypothetical protein